MIKCNLAVLLAERNMRISELSKRTGISRTTLTSLAHNQSKGIQYDTFDTLCTFLKISPNDLFIHEFFDYDFEVSNHRGNPFDPYEPTAWELTCHTKIVYKDEVIEEKISIIASPFINFDEIESINLTPRFSFEMDLVLNQIPVTFITNMNDEIIDAVHAYLNHQFNVDDDINYYVN